jgi:long-chain acyl-CoA synthetase
MNRPWLAHYDADVPASAAPYPDRTLIEYLDELAAGHGRRPALLFKGNTMSYGALNAESDAFAAALARDGVRPRDRVALVLPNAPQFFVAEFGAWKAGATVVPLNPTYSERELEAALEADAGDDARERERDALEGVVVVVEDDHPPGVARSPAAARARPLLGRSRSLGAHPSF